MITNQQLNTGKFFSPASTRQRFWATGILVFVAMLFVVLWLAAKGLIDIGQILGPCGFKQRYHLPCPTCGMTAAAIAFVSGKIFEAFYIQPAAALLSCILAIIGFWALFVATFGVNFPFLNRVLTKVKTRYLILAILVIIAGGWVVTLARALAENAG